jgi:predicted permease
MNFWTRLEALVRDFQFASRLLVRRPLFAAAVILTVGIGVGANTAVVSVLETVLLNPLGLRHADPVMVARTQFAKLGLFHAHTSGVEFRELQSFTDTFSAVAAMEGREWTWLADGEASRLVGQAVTADFFRAFGEHPTLGRFFAADDGEYNVVLSGDVWRSRFGADASAVRRTIVLDGRSYAIIGVAPDSFRFPARAQIWIPLKLDPKRLLDSERGHNVNLTVLARRNDGVSEAQAVDRVKRYVGGLKSADAVQGGEISKYDYDIELSSLGRYVAGDLRRPLLLLWGAALVVLVTGCANIAGLLLTRTSQRRHEIAIRIAMGASAGQVMRQLLTESVLLCAMGGVAGLVGAAVALPMLNWMTIPGAEMLPLASIDFRLILYGMALALASGLLAGLAPAIQLLQRSQSFLLARGRQRRFQDVLVAAEVCGAFVMIVVTVLLLRSLWAVERIELGFDADGVSTAFFIKPDDSGFYKRLLTSLYSSPGVQSAALANPIPFADTGVVSGFAIKNREQPSGLLGQAQGVQITPDYFRTLHIPLLRGRNLDSSDTAGSALVCVIDSTLAEQSFPGQDPIGQEIAMFKGWARIVGVVGAIRGSTLEEGSRKTVYYSIDQIPFFPYAAVVVRSSGPAHALIRAAVRQANPAVPVYDVKLLNERLGETLGLRRAVVLLLSVFGAISLLLAIVGVYGVIAQIVSDRTREIGIRIALGARRAHILSHFMQQGLRAGVVGLILGLVVVNYAQRWFAGMLYRVKAFDPATLSSAIVGVLAVLAIAVWWPARRAAGIDPQQALRHE